MSQETVVTKATHSSNSTEKEASMAQLTDKYSIKYSVMPNGSGHNDDKGYHIRSVANDDPVAWDMLLPELIDSTEISAQQFETMMARLKTVVTNKLAAGNTVSIDGFLKLRNGFEGSSKSSDITLPSPDFKLVTHVEADQNMTNEILNKCKFEETVPKEPVINKVINNTDDSENTYTAGGMLSIYGDNLKFDRRRKDEGVYAVDSDGKHIKLQTADVTNGKIIVLIPAGVKGESGLIVKARYTKQGLLRDNKPFILADALQTNNAPDDNEQSLATIDEDFF